jgi:putative FmdB family regulatory protein
MPTYEYRCERCERTVEVVQRFSDGPLTTCASCGGPLRKVYAPVGIVFKGSGFYKTDSRGSSKSGKKAGSADGASTSATNGSGEQHVDGASTPAKADRAATTGAKSDGAKADSAKAAPAATGSGGSSGSKPGE